MGPVAFSFGLFVTHARAGSDERGGRGARRILLLPALARFRHILAAGAPRLAKVVPRRARAKQFGEGC
jgi:hypothetical protein